MTDWFDNDDLFRRELETGHRWAQKVVDRLVKAGLAASLTPMAWRRDIDDRHRFANEGDIRVATRLGEVLVESKSRGLNFSEDSSSYPWPTALVDTVSGWDQKEDTPAAVVLVSQRTEAMLVVPVRRTRSSWTVKVTRDRVRRIEDRWYEVDRQLLEPFPVLIDWLRRRGDPT